MGGRSRNPTLIASQVELQTTHSVTNAAMIEILVRPGIAYERTGGMPLQPFLDFQRF
jgi:hypothetical protein